MTDDQNAYANPDADAPDSLDILRQRAAASRRARDESVADLRQHLSDEEVLDTFGIDLSRLDDG